MPSTADSTMPKILPASTRANTALCAEHFRITLVSEGFPTALPGQFVQIRPPIEGDEIVTTPIEPINFSASQTATRKEQPGSEHSSVTVGGSANGSSSTQRPYLPRAFSIEACRTHGANVEIDLVYRTVGVATRWMASLKPGDPLTVMGPLGKPFPISPTKPRAALVIGGVGFPPLRFLANALHRAGKQSVAFFGARTANLLPLDLHNCDAPPPPVDARTATLCAPEFAACNTPMVISTDDGSCGYHGRVVDAMKTYYTANPIVAEGAAGELVVYACGPEPMLQAVARYCQARGIECQVCVERPMACGVGTCQSCIVEVKSEPPTGASRYALCCTDGPVFDAECVVWSDSAQGHAQ